MSKSPIIIFGRPLSLALLVAYKTLWGLLESVFGLGLLVAVFSLQHLAGSRFVHALVTKELSEDPHDAFIGWFLTHDIMSYRHVMAEIGVVLLVLGVLKIVLAIGVWERSWLMRDIFMILLALGGLISLVALARHFSTFRFATLALDVLVFYYLWQVLPKYLHHQPPPPPS